MSQKAKVGDKVKVNYVGKLADGTVIETTENHTPFVFELGEEQLNSGFARAVIGMSPGEKKTVTIPPEEAYGDISDDMIVRLKREWLPAGAAPQVGQQIELQHQDGSTVDVTVTNVDDSGVVVDGNHPLAGEPLTFQIELLEVE